MSDPSRLLSEEIDPSLQTYDLFDCFERWVKEKPNQVAMRFVSDTELNFEAFTFPELYKMTQAAAAVYRQAGLKKGDRVLIELPTCPGFVAALMGAFYIGLIPAVIAPPEMRDSRTGQLEWQHHVDQVKPHVMVSVNAPLVGDLLHFTAEQLMAGDASAAGERTRNEDQAYIQFSSGSTGAPKALLLSMEAIVFNMDMLARRIPVLPFHRHHSWLPLYHDMGLFGNFLLVFYIGHEMTLADPTLFARSPIIWFRLVSEFNVTGTVGPPSAVAGALSMLERRKQEGLDLSSLNSWLVGAEQVTPHLIRRFLHITEPYNARSDVLKPVYGMAEITLAATIQRQFRVPIWDRVQRETFELKGLAVAAEADAPDQECLEWTACGSPLDGQKMRIADDGGNDLPDRHVGRILLNSPSLYSGFLCGDEFEPRTDPWHDTGDLGYVANGDTYITGRSREVIIKNGRNYAPERLEDLASTVEGVGRGAAFGVFDPARETEMVVLYVEVHNRYMREAADRDKVRMAVRTALTDAGFAVDQIELRPRRFLARTTSGKIRRSYIRKQHIAELDSAK